MVIPVSLYQVDGDESTTRWQDSEVRAIMQEVNAVEGVSKVQLIMATSAW